ncbi:zinc finger protein 391-like [Culicoides brevitarsis]|uniref:zinc finger protein 391-like n=1 Tax=Culicoides brevitarsis TaxID=469753 RepID=UPI00307BCE03
MEENSSEKSKSVPTNFSIERILLKSDNETVNKAKPLNKVTPNPWLSITPPMSFKPKVIQQSASTSSMRVIPSASSSSSSAAILSPSSPSPPQLQTPLFPINPLYTSFLQQFPAASSFFHHADLYRDKLLPSLATNNNLIAVNNYNYFFENHFKQVQNLTANLSSKVYHRSPSGSPLLSPSAMTLMNNNNNESSEISAKKMFLMQHNDGNSNGSACSSLVGEVGNNLDDEGLKCGICNKMFGCAETLEAHEKSHRSPRYECDECGKGFSQLRNFKYHVSVHRGTKEFAAKCPECGKIFNDKGYLSSHMKIHRNKKEYKCPHCVKSFNQRVAFNMHIRIHTGVKPHKCDQCNKRFSRKMLLKQHSRTHSGEKPYQCTVCGKTFADRSNMTLHHRLHSGVKPFACPICPKAFTKKHHLKTHINYHTGYKPYKCPHENCGQTFTQSSNMRTHAKKCQFKKPEDVV